MGSSTSLPTLQQNLFKAFFTILRKCNTKNQKIAFQKTFQSVFIHEKQLFKYKSFFNFSTALPFTYLYLLAQRVQVQCMLDKKFCIPIPGLIHIENDIKLLVDINKSKPLEIICNVNVDIHKDTSFEVFFHQDNKKVAICKSTYLYNKKSKKHQKETSPKIIKEKGIADFITSKKQILEYAKISGDFNPIHISGVIARFFGFKKNVVHGWYLVSKIASIIEEREGITLHHLYCHFLKPVYINQNCTINKVNEGEHYYIVTSETLNVKVIIS